MAEEAVPKTRWLGKRQREIQAIEQALSEFLPDPSRTSAERDLVHDIRMLTRSIQIKANDLGVLNRIVSDIKAIIIERSRSN